VTGAHAVAAVLAGVRSWGICKLQIPTVRLPGMITSCLTGNKFRMKICPKLEVPAPQ
jgi:hypothetical protein